MLFPAKVAFESLGFTPGFPSLSHFPCNPWTVSGDEPGACTTDRAKLLAGLGDFGGGATTTLGIAAALAALWYFGRKKQKRTRSRAALRRLGVQ